MKSDKIFVAALPFALLGVAIFSISSALAMCPGPQIQTTQIKGQDLVEIQTRLSDQAKKELQRWDDNFKKVRIGNTTREELSRLFANLQKGYADIHPMPIRNGQTSLHETESFTPSSRKNSPNVRADASEIYIYNYRLSPPLISTTGTHAYYCQYEFEVNTASQLVQDKERSFFSESVTGSVYNGPCLKPVIYLYPTQKQNVTVRLRYAGEMDVSYPRYDSAKEGWAVTAYPDGKIIGPDQEEYSYIFWEGKPVHVPYDLSEGFVVKGEDAEAFLKEKLKALGLKPKEYNEFIVYWYPKLKVNKYNLIHFAHEEYENIAKLEVTPKPDSVLRVFIVCKPLAERIELKPQAIRPFKRIGFSVIEWGGTELSKN